MNAVDLLLNAWDAALKHDFESLDSVIKGLTPEEAEWQSPIYAGEPHDDGIGKRGTVLWHLNHLEHYHRIYAACLRMRPYEQEPDLPPPGELGPAEILARLEAANHELRSEIARLTPDALDDLATARQRVAEFALAAIRHLSWHASQIAVARRMFKLRAWTEAK